MADKTSIVKEAQKYLARGQIDKAIAEWEKLAKEYPDGSAFNAIGDLYLKKGDKKNAIDSYHHAASFFKQEGFALKALALYKKILNINEEDDGALVALGELTERKGLVTDAIKFYLAAADSLSKSGNREKLLSIYENILVLSPENIPLRMKLADLYVQSGLLPEAIKQYFRIAQLHNESGDTDKAVEYYRKILDKEPTNRHAIIELNMVYEKSGDTAKAIAHLTDVVNQLPQDTEILLRAAELHGALQKLAEAGEFLDRVIEIEPANIKAKKIRGDLFRKEGKMQQAWEEYLPILDDILLEESENDAVKLLESFRDIDPVETGKRLVTLFMQSGNNQKLVEQLLALGDIFLRNEKSREALNYYREAYKNAPDDEELRTRVIELEKKVGKEHLAIGAEKTCEEAGIEADIYLKYGLPDKALDILESFAQKEPDNVELHLKLKELYAQTGKTGAAVAECIILHELYEKAGDLISSSAAIRAGLDMSPDDPRLAGFASLLTEGAEAGESDTEGHLPDEFREELTEADIYIQQGLLREAREILGRLSTRFPDNQEIRQKFIGLQQIAADTASEGIVSPEAQHPESLPDALYAEEVPEPPSESNVMDIFNEFKKGLEKEIEAEDYETHYNLGIAYKEMGLVDDAIREFQASRNDPKKFVHASNMLGMCYIEKGLYPLAIDVLKSSLSRMEQRDESYWTIQYDLAEAYEKNNNVEEALKAYLQVYEWNSEFRDTVQKISELKTVVLEKTAQQRSKEKKDRVSYL